MKRKLISISLIIALLLTALIPASTLARGWHSPFSRNAGRFSVVLTPTAIDDTVLGEEWPVRNDEDTNVWPIYDLVEGEPTITGWIVDGRSIYGDAEGDFAGPFSLTYGGVLDTLQSGAINGVITIQTTESTIYLAGEADLEAEVLDYYGFAEIQGWCSQVGYTVGEVFAGIYGIPDLAALPDEILEGMYGDPLSMLPKTLTAEFSGSVKVEAATGINSGISGQGKIQPDGREPLILHLYPTQHAYALEGAIKLTGTYVKKRIREFEVDRGQLGEWLEQWNEQWENQWNNEWNDQSKDEWLNQWEEQWQD